MWATNSLWFEVAIVSAVYALGNIAFGHFEEQTPKLPESEVSANAYFCLRTFVLLWTSASLSCARTALFAGHLYTRVLLAEEEGDK